MKFLSRLLCTALGAALLISTGVHARTVVIGHVNLSFYEATAAVFQSVLERSGYNVAMKKGPHSIMYPLLAEGEFDLFVAAWLPNTHQQYWEEFSENLTLVTPLYSDAKLFWAVPDYVPESEVKSVADLAKPQVAAKMQKTIRGPGADSGLMMRSKSLMEHYGLQQAGYELAPGKAKDWIDAFNTNTEAQNWFVMPLWQPQYLNKVAKLRILEEPENILGEADTAWLVAHKSARKKIPKHIFAILERMEFSVKWITELDYMVNVEGFSPREAARVWMTMHPHTIDYWIDAE
ncbi:MAG TPA: glycine betaine ABC transporter substrate-binding protein [Burkholderiales bacterium]|nr:glycine betaine ABC transporter substrate-binding protein [Burkholderiales bacterium]